MAIVSRLFVPGVPRGQPSCPAESPGALEQATGDTHSSDRLTA